MNGMPAAQARYDAAEPPEVKPCWFCDDQGEVDITEVKNRDGYRYTFANRTKPPTLRCPVCRLDIEVLS